MSKWQSIETAPMPLNDMGPAVLVHVNSMKEDYRVAVARYWGGWSTVEDGLDIEPTHWMPLPDPPKQAE